eukprot:CAMPEP_0195140570 /NCGR_PEP_ID=MMETSP0448-20130528/161378_1 /TAXON_ID=66468 /ORGANISM="Heterocapsa triquestra, Strain CCMP 448" /LENGTH=46 /DNA_ID= /DNA_START= /DNA_END= /DNA_ORIENTATION=
MASEAHEVLRTSATFQGLPNLAALVGLQLWRCMPWKATMAFKGHEV